VVGEKHQPHAGSVLVAGEKHQPHAGSVLVVSEKHQPHTGFVLVAGEKHQSHAGNTPYTIITSSPQLLRRSFVIKFLLAVSSTWRLVIS